MHRTRVKLQAWKCQPGNESSHGSSALDQDKCVKTYVHYFSSTFQRIKCFSLTTFQYKQNLSETNSAIVEIHLCFGWIAWPSRPGPASMEMYRQPARKHWCPLKAWWVSAWSQCAPASRSNARNCISVCPAFWLGSKGSARTHTHTQRTH